VGAKVTSDDKLEPVALWQCLCKVHGRFRLYPDFLLPHKHYVIDVVDAALESRAVDTPLDEFCRDWGLHDRSTPTRWIAAFRARLDVLADTAQHLLEELLSAASGPRPPTGYDYAFVWAALGRLREAYLECGLVPPSRSYLALFA